MMSGRRGEDYEDVAWSSDDDDDILNPLTGPLESIRQSQHGAAGLELLPIKAAAAAPTSPKPISSTTSSPFDPYSPDQRVVSSQQKSSSNVKSKKGSKRSLSSYSVQRENESSSGGPFDMTTPGIGGFLEIEEEPPRYGHERRAEADLLGITYEPTQTDSGLLLTHRRTPPTTTSIRSRQPTGPTFLHTSQVHAPSRYENDRVTTNKKTDVPSRSLPSMSFLRNIPLLSSMQQERGNSTLEVDTGGYGTASDGSPLLGRYNGGGPHFESNSSSSFTWFKNRRIISMVRLYLATFFLLMALGSSIAMIAFKHEGSHSSEKTTIQSKEVKESSYQNSSTGKDADVITIVKTEPATTATDWKKKIKIVPIQRNMTKLRMAQPTYTNANNIDDPKQESGMRRKLKKLEAEFEEWVHEHERDYGSEAEKNKRFKVWADNHHRTLAKNKKHGPCKMTNKHVFGSNHFKDLTREEFKNQFLTGYKGPRADEIGDHPALQTNTGISKQHRGKRKRNAMQKLSLTGMRGTPTDTERGDPRTSIERAPEIQKRYVDLFNKTSGIVGDIGESIMNKAQAFGDKATRRMTSSSTSSEPYTYLRSRDCDWYGVSCWVRWFFNKYIVFAMGGTMEPAYNSNNYPSAFDWRDVGVVTDVHYQGSCGACWGITAVETIESAYAIYSGSLIDLAETEVIACDGTCEMCDGGWPQNAYEYTISNNGLPAENNLYYDGDFLYSLSSYVAGNGDGSLSTYEAESFFAATCPSGGRGDSSGSQSDSGDQNYGSYATYDSSQKRYGKIKGYGYTTDRCICYSDGTGCTCEDQDESLAVRNVASYGPATVCLEASLWQDYSSGIMTSDIGCTQEFADMNHCVQVVGYAYTDGSNNGDDYQDNEDSKSNSGDSGDDTQREGYWIVRNQWGSNWGMNGYAYVAMGSNTCGILNDMTQVYFN